MEPIQVTILYEPYSFPTLPYGIYEVIRTSTGETIPGNELARFATFEEAVRYIRRMGWKY